MTEIRPFHRADRDQLTALVNVHIAAVVPGWAVSTATLLSSLEHDPSQYVVDPWVASRLTFVAVDDERIVAAAHLKTYAADARVSDDYSGAGEIAWLVCWPRHVAAGCVLADACVAELSRRQVTRIWADGALPTPATYGVPDSWPHVRSILAHAGFDLRDGRTELLLAGALDRVEPVPAPPLPGLRLRREVGSWGTRFVASTDGGDDVGEVYVRDDLTRGGVLTALAGWAELTVLKVQPASRNQGIGTWLVSQAVDWLRLGGASRILVPVAPDQTTDPVPFFARFGWVQIGSTRRGWRRPVAS